MGNNGFSRVCIAEGENIALKQQGASQAGRSEHTRGCGSQIFVLKD